jgi:hypothetical protein
MTVCSIASEEHSRRPLQFFVLDSGPAYQEITKIHPKKLFLWIFLFLFHSLRAEMNIFLEKKIKSVISFWRFNVFGESLSTGGGR